MKYLVTGVAGFIASRTAELLLEAGHEVVGVDNVNDYYDRRIKVNRLYRLAKLVNASDFIKDTLAGQQAAEEDNVLVEWFKGERFQFKQLDIEDRSACEQLFDEHLFDAVLNLAARAGVRYSMENPYVYMTTNAMATLNLLEQMRHKGCPKMVLASTSSLYAGLPMPFNEDLPVNTPLSPYAASKKAAEAMCYSYYKLYDLDISVVRYFTVFGPAGRPDMCIFRFIKWIDEGTPIELFGDGSQSRDFTFVDDIARGTIKATKHLGYEVMNLGGGQNPISLNEIISWLEEMLGKKALIDHKPFHKADIKETWADISKADKLIDWRPEVGVKEGVQACVDWYRENKSWLKDVRL